MVTLMLEAPTRRRAFASEPVIVTLAVTAFIVVVLICSALLSPIVWTALTSISPQDSPSTAAQCGTVSNDSLRLACYDKIAGRPLPQPAKGAFAPLFNHPAR